MISKIIENRIARLLQDDAIQYMEGLIKCNVPTEIAQRNLAIIHDFIASRTIVTLLCSHILSLIRSCVPEKVNIDNLKPKPCPYRDSIKCCTMQDFARNQACDEMEKNMENL